MFAADEQRPRNNDKKRNNDDDEKNNNMAAIEQDVIESTRARLDLQRVANTVLISDEDRIGKAVDQGMTLTWKISLAAAFGAGSVTYLVFKNVVVAGVAAFATAVAAMGDPLEEESIAGEPTNIMSTCFVLKRYIDSFTYQIVFVLHFMKHHAGALARVVGRFTLQSVDATQSKLRAIARAVIMGEEEEISVLQGQLQAMEQEVSELRRWKQLRIAVDEALPNVALDDLKELARNNGITVGGTKAQLLMRLVEAGIINL